MLRYVTRGLGPGTKQRNYMRVSEDNICMSEGIMTTSRLWEYAFGKEFEFEGTAREKVLSCKTVKVKKKFSCWLTKHHAMKSYPLLN